MPRARRKRALVVSGRNGLPSDRNESPLRPVDAQRYCVMTALISNESRTWLTTSEVARTLRVSEQTVRTHAQQLGAIQVGRQLRFPPDFDAPTLNPSTRAQRPPEAPNRPTSGRIR